MKKEKRDGKYYSKFDESVDHRVKTFRWPFWLLPLLFLCLILVLGLFIFITLHSTGRFCLFHCEQKIDDGGLVPPTDDGRYGENSEKGEKDLYASEKRKHKDKMITIQGKIIFPKDHQLKSIPLNSQLKVTVEDTSIADAPSQQLCRTIVDLKKFKDGSNITYSMKCKPPSEDVGHRRYSVSAVFNIGWIPKLKGDEWLRKHDYFTDTDFSLELTKEGKEFERDVELAYYS